MKFALLSTPAARRNAAAAMSLTAAMVVGLVMVGSTAQAQTPTAATTAESARTGVVSSAAVDLTAPLSFDLPARSAHQRMVFAHYFTPYPISLDNKTPMRTTTPSTTCSRPARAASSPASADCSATGRSAGPRPVTGSWRTP